MTQGAQVLAFARPHELEIVVPKNAIDGTTTGAMNGIHAKITRILSFSANSKIELDGTNGATGQHFEVELARQRVQELNLLEGQQVLLVPSHLSVFEEAGSGI